MTGIADRAISQAFDNWAETRVADRLLAFWKEQAKEFSESISFNEFVSSTGVSRSPIVRLFGSWLDFEVGADMQETHLPG